MSAGTRVPDDWFAGFHEGLVARFWRAAGEAMADDDARLVLALLGERPLRVLDVPCGNGRIARRLAAAGHEVAGIDIAPEEVALARRAAPDARFEVGDLRALPDLGAFDAVVSWGNSFGYLRPAESAASLAGMHAVLRPGGRLILESLTVAESFLPRPIERARGVRVRRHPDDAGQPLPRGGEPAGERADARGRRRRASSTPAASTTSTRRARWCGCSRRRASRDVELRADAGAAVRGRVAADDRGRRRASRARRRGSRGARRRSAPRSPRPARATRAAPAPRSARGRCRHPARELQRGASAAGSPNPRR